MNPFGEMLTHFAPRVNKEVLEGYCYHRCKDIEPYIDDYIQYNSKDKTNTHLEYLGMRRVTPQEEVLPMIRKPSNYPYKLESNSIFLTELQFKYADYEEPLNFWVYLPYIKRGNTMDISNKDMVVKPTIATKVINIGKRSIFINITTAKHNFLRTNHVIKENGRRKEVTVVISELWKNPKKKFQDTTSAEPTAMNYMLAYYGYRKTMELMLGFVPEAGYNLEKKEGFTLVTSTGAAPNKWKDIDGKEAAPDSAINYGESEFVNVNPDGYKSTQIGFLIPNELYTEHVRYILGNMLYIIDHFPTKVTIGQFDDVLMWRRFIGEITLTGYHTIGHLTRYMKLHLDDLTSLFEPNIIVNLRSYGMKAERLIELLALILKDFPNMIATGNKPTYYGTRTIETLTQIANSITSSINKIYFDVTKGEISNGGQPLEIAEVKAFFKERLRMYGVLNALRKCDFTEHMDDSTDHLYPKRTAHVVFQESEFVNYKAGSGNTSDKKKLIASVASVGSICHFPKENPTGEQRINICITTDPETDTIIEDPEWNFIVEETDAILQSELHSDVTNLSDEAIEAMELDDDFLDHDIEFDDEVMSGD